MTQESRPARKIPDWYTFTEAEHTVNGVTYKLVRVMFTSGRVRYEIVTDCGGCMLSTDYRSSAIRKWKVFGFPLANLNA